MAWGVNWGRSAEKHRRTIHGLILELPEHRTMKIIAAFSS